MKYRSKVIEIKAFRLGFDDYPTWFICHSSVTIYRVNDLLQAEIKTLEGTMTANYGDWIICGTEGELYPCKPSVFERKYEAVT